MAGTWVSESEAWLSGLQLIRIPATSKGCICVDDEGGSNGGSSTGPMARNVGVLGPVT